MPDGCIGGVCAEECGIGFESEEGHFVREKLFTAFVMGIF